MSTGKFISLEEVRKNPKLLKRFMKERASQGDADAFESTLNSMIKNSGQAGQTSREERGDRSSGTRTRPGKNEDT